MLQKTLLGISLFAVFVLVSGLFAVAYAEGPTYVGNAKCKMCHNKPAEGEAWAKWQATKHAKALESLKSDAAKAMAQKAGVKTPPAESPECLRCHVTGYVKGQALPTDVKMEDGVQCETCHGPASEHLAEARKSLAGKSVPKVLPKKVTEDVCKKCHNPESPTFKEFDFQKFSAKIAHPNPLRKAPKQ